MQGAGDPVEIAVLVKDPTNPMIAVEDAVELVQLAQLLFDVVQSVLRPVQKDSPVGAIVLMSGKLKIAAVLVVQMTVEPSARM